MNTATLSREFFSLIDPLKAYFRFVVRIVLGNDPGHDKVSLEGPFSKRERDATLVHHLSSLKNDRGLKLVF
jgi:hypothetical protein